MSESMALIGLDVHKAQTLVAVLDPVSGEHGGSSCAAHGSTPALTTSSGPEPKTLPYRAGYGSGSVAQPLDAPRQTDCTLCRRSAG